MADELEELPAISLTATSDGPRAIQYRSKTVSRIKAQTSWGNSSVFHHQLDVTLDGSRVAVSDKSTAPGTRKGAMASRTEDLVERL